MITVSAPGKIHLMGEHAVVYGYPALLTAINLRMKVTIEDALGSTGLTVVSPEDTTYAKYAVDFLLHALDITDPKPCTIRIASEIPAGFHLGSSAATAVCISGAMMYFYKRIWNPIRINELAYEIEKKQHGNPSGGDNTVVTMGGLIWYRKELEFLRSIWQLPFKTPSSLNHFMILNTGKPKESTGDMVSMVKLKMEHENITIEEQFRRNEIQTRRITTAIKEGNEIELIGSIREGEQTLEAIGVVSGAVVPCIRAIEHAGGAAKILGGGGLRGGVGCLLCYHSDPSILLSISKKYSFPMTSIQLSEEGVRLDEK